MAFPQHYMTECITSEWLFVWDEPFILSLSQPQRKGGNGTYWYADMLDECH